MELQPLCFECVEELGPGVILISSGIIRLERRTLLDTPEISVLPCRYLSSGTPKTR